MITFIADKNRKLSKLALEKSTDLSFSTIMKLLRNKDIKVNGKRTNDDLNLSVGDSVEIYYTPKESVCYEVLFCDANILIVNKKSGYQSEEVFNRVKEKYGDARFIHRLDRNTSGILAFALNGVAEKELLDGFKNHSFVKYYSATVKGTPKVKEAVLCHYLLKDKESATVKIYDKPVKGTVPIKTGYKVIRSDGQTSELSVRLYTGKTHQIRAHLAYIGYPIVGDGKYGDVEFNKKAGVKSQMLTAKRLVFHFGTDSPLHYLDAKEFSV